MTNNIGEKLEQKPSLGFMIILNALLFFGLCSYGSENSFSMAISLAITFIFFIVSAVILLVIHLFIRKRQLHPAIRTVIFLTPLLLIFALGLFIHTADIQTRPENKRNPVKSFDQKFEAKIYTEDGVWQYEIYSNAGKLLHHEITDEVGHLNTYWKWDKDNRFWIYVTDYGRIFYLKQNPDRTWSSEEWGNNHTKEINRKEIYLPKGLIPERQMRLNQNRTK